MTDKREENMPNLLTPADVALYVEWLVFMPNWTFVAMPNYYGSEDYDYVTVRIVRNQPDTDYPPLYEETMEWHKDVTVDLRTVGDLDDVGHKILSSCIEWMNDSASNEHEAREFFRVNKYRNPTATGHENYRAPFHPHRISGHAAWNARSEQPSQGC